MIGVIPSGGQAVRWGVYIKELLPIDNNASLIDNAVDTCHTVGCRSVIIPTTTEKIDTLAYHLSKRTHHIPTYFTLGGKEMWQSIENAIKIIDESVFMCMPDTVPVVPKKWVPQADIEFGLFQTREASRFSVFINGEICTKDPAIPNGEPYDAWGVVYWSADVNRFFQSHQFDHYDRAFQAAMKNFPWMVFHLERYVDMASFDDYRRYMKEISQ